MPITTGACELLVSTSMPSRTAAEFETVLPNIRRFLLDHNVRWPTLVNGSGQRDYAIAYGISDIPANVLIGREGAVVQIDLSRGTSNPWSRECSVTEHVIGVNDYQGVDGVAEAISGG